MKTASFTYWQDGDYYLGFLNDYPITRLRQCRRKNCSTI